MTGHTKGSMHLSGSRHKLGSATFHTLLIYDDKAKRDEVVAEVYFCERTGLGLADGERLAACWNALAGIPDPAAFVEAARGLAEEAAFYADIDRKIAATLTAFRTASGETGNE